MEDFVIEKPFKRKPTNKRIFEVYPDYNLQKNLKFFMQQELFYFNTLVDAFNSRIKAFPQDVMSIKDRDVKLLETCGQFAFNPNKLLSTKADSWPEALKSYVPVVYDTDGKQRLTSRQVAIMEIGTTPATIHHQVRRNIISELFSTVKGQAAIFLAAQKTEQLRAPVQMLQRQEWNTKHHLQIPRTIIEMSYNSDTNATDIKTPYNKESIKVSGYDLTEIPFTIMILRAPVAGEDKPAWRIELKDVTNRYILNLTDPRPYKKKRKQ